MYKDELGLCVCRFKVSGSRVGWGGTIHDESITDPMRQAREQPDFWCAASVVNISGSCL